MTHINDFVTIEKYAEMTGLSEEAIRQYKKKGQWRENIHWYKAPNGRIFIKIEAANEWIKGKLA